MARGADGSIVIDTALDNSGFEAGSAKLSKACDSLIGKIGDMGARLQSGFASTSGIDRMAARAAMAQHQIDVLQDKLKAFGNTPIKTEDYEGLENALKKAEAELLKYQDRQNLMRDMGIGEQTAQWQRLAVQIANTEAIIRQYRMEMEYMRRSGQDTVMGFQTEQYKALIGKIATAKEQLAQFSAEQQKAAEKARKLERVNTAFANISKSIKGAIKRLFSFNRASRSSAGATNSLIRQLTSLRTLLISRIRRTFITQVATAVRDSIQTLAKYSKEFDTAISGIRNAFKELGANISVAMSGALNAIAPIVTQIINWLSKIITYVSAFIAMLSGKNTVMVAKKQTDSYAKSLDKTAKSAKKAQLALAGFDEINSITTQKDSGGGGGTSAGSLFEEKEISSMLPDALKGWFEKLKSAIQAGDWYGLGNTMAEGINYAVKTVHDKIKGIDFKQIGTDIAKFLNGSVHGVNWGEIGATLSDGMDGLLDTIIGFLETLDWDGIGVSIAEFILAVDWENLTRKTAESVGLLIGGALKGVWGFLRTMIADKLTEWAGEDGELTAQEVIRGFIETWSDLAFWNFRNIAIPIGKKLAESLFGIDEEMFRAGIDAIEGFFNGILSKSDFGKWIKEHLFDPFMKWFRKLFGIESPSTVMAEQGRYITEGLLNGIKDKLKNVRTWVQTNIFTPVKNAVSSAFGIAGNVARKFLDVGSALVAGVKNGINNAWSAFKQWVERKFSGIIDGVKGVFGIHSPSKVFAQIGGYLMSGLAEGIDDDKAMVLRSVADIASSAEDAFDGKTLSIDTAGFDGVLSVLDRIAAKISDITDSLGNLHVPAMATGEVIPYRAKIVDTAYTGGAGDGGNLKQTIIDALRALGLDNTTIQVLLDGQKVYDSVVDYSKRDIRRTGRYPILGE